MTAKPHYAWRELLATTAVVGVAVLFLLPPLGPSGKGAGATPNVGAIGPISKVNLSKLALPPTGRDCRVQRTGGGVRSAPAVRRSVALTFDDGPSNFSVEILRILHRYGAHATFFVNGVWIDRPARQHVLRQELADGNEIGNHTESHADLTKLTRKQIDGELDETQRRIDAATGFRPCLFRPPYGSIDSFVLRRLNRHRFSTVLWSADSSDYKKLPAKTIAYNVLSAVTPGRIVLMHDGVINRQRTVKALPIILRGLRRRGIEAVTVSQLFSPGGHGSAGTRAALAIRAP